MAVRTANAGSANWAAAFPILPTAADDVIIPTGATVTIPTAYTALCRSFSVTGTGTIIFTNTTSCLLNIGDGTAGASNVAISISGTATVTIGASAIISLVSTSATQQTIDVGGKTLPTINFNGAGSSYILTSPLLVSNTTTWSQGIFNSGNYAITSSSYNIGGGLTRTITLGTSALTSTGAANNWIFGNLSGLTFTANTAVLTITGSTVSNNNVLAMSTFNTNGMSVVINGGGQGALSIAGATITNLTINGTANQSAAFRVTGSFTVPGTLTLTGNSALNRPTIYGQTPGTPVVITAANTSISNFDFKDITAAGAGAWTTTSGVTGDKLGNTGITFTTGAATTMSTAGSTNDATKWSGGRVPLPQDDVTFSGSVAINMNALVIGKNVTFTGYTGTLTLTSSGFEYELFGSITLGSGMSWGTNPNTFIIGLNGRGTHTITSNGKAFFPSGSNGTLSIKASGGSYTLADAFNYRTPVSAGFQPLAGTFDSGGYQMDIGRYVTNGTITRSNILRTSLINLYITTGSTFITAAATGNTMDALSSTFNVAVASSNTRTLDLSGIAIGTFSYTIPSSTGLMAITTSGYIDTLNVSDTTTAKNVRITSGQTLSVNNFNVVGASGRVVVLDSSAAGSPAYIEVLGAPSTTDYLSVKDMYGVIPNKLYAGVNSTDVSGNTNIEFTATPTGPYISRRADVQTANTTSSTATFAYGLAPSVGRKIIAFYTGTNNITGTITPPAGFTQIGSTVGTTPWISMWEGISDGTQTSLTFSKSGTAPQIGGIKAYSLGGFNGTATFDVSDTNGVLATTSINSAGSAPSNTDNPAIAIMLVTGNNALGNSVSATNGFGVMRDSVELTAIRGVSKTLFTNAPVSTTYTWTTARNATSLLVVYKDFLNPNRTFITYKPAWRS